MTKPDTPTPVMSETSGVADIVPSKAMSRPNWTKYAGDFRSMTDSQINMECKRAQDLIDSYEEWIEAVAEWKKAGKPREQGGF